MGFFYGKASNANEYILQINNINHLGVPKSLTKDIELVWATCLRICSYNPLEAKKVMDSCSLKEIYEAYVMYHFDNFADA